jgi:hypothetical protein
MMICFPTPDPFLSHAGSDFNAMETEKPLGDHSLAFAFPPTSPDGSTSPAGSPEPSGLVGGKANAWECWATILPEFAKHSQFFPEDRTYRTDLELIAPFKYSTHSLVTLTAGHLTHPRIAPCMPFRLQKCQEGLGYPSARDMRHHHRRNFGPGPERVFPGQAKCLHRGRGHRVGCRPGALVCGPGRPGGKTLDPPLAACAAPSAGLPSLPRPQPSSTTSRPPNY